MLTFNSLIGQIETEQIEVVKAFEVTLEDARKETINPKMEVIVPVKKLYEYDVTIIPLSLQYPDPIIKPLGTPVDKPFPSTNIYAKAGYGNLKNPYGMLRYSLHNAEKYDLNVFGNLLGVDNTKNIDFQKMLSANGGFTGKFRIQENMYLKAGSSIEYDKRYFFFTPFDHTLSKAEDLKRKTGIIDFNVGVENIEETDFGLDYDANFHGAIVNTTNTNADQQNIGIKASISKRKSDLARIIVPIEADIYRYHNPETNNTYTFKTLSFKPQFHYNSGKIVVDVGLAGLVDDESTKIWPFVDVAYGLMNNYIQVFAGTDQISVTNDLKYSLRTCPWIESSIENIRNMVNREYYGGLRGEFAHLSYQARAGYRQGFNQPLYINFKAANQANLVFDKPNQFYSDFNTIFINGNVDFWYNKFLTVGGALTKNFYRLDNAKEAWGLPSLELNAYAKLSMLNDKLKLKTEVYIADKSKSLFLKPSANVIPEIVVGNNLVDLNLELEFWPIQKFGLYFQANNLLNNKYARWYGYQQVGLNLNGGVVVNL